MKLHTSCPESSDSGAIHPSRFPLPKKKRKSLNLILMTGTDHVIGNMPYRRPSAKTISELPPMKDDDGPDRSR